MRIPSSAADRHRWDDGSACGLIPDRLDAIAASDPDRLAFLSSQEELTFAELEQQSCTVAAALVDWGVRPGQTIALLCRAAAAQVVASVGVLRAGAISVTLNPAHPLERLAWILSDSQATLLIHDQAHQALAARLAQQALPCRALPHLLDASSVSWSRPEITPDAGAFINYSSGSTGKPKGILHTHRSTLQLSLAAGCRNVAPGERVLLCGNSMAFNRTILQAATCCHWPLEALGLDGLQQWIRKSCPSIFLGTPSIFRLLVQLLGDSLVDLPLRRVLLTGEPLYRRELETFRSHLPADALIVNQLGSNESKTFAQFEIASSTVVDEDVVPVGLPLEGKLVRVVDATGTDCLVGQTGEIVVTAAGLPPGYWRRADLTRRAFEKCAGSNGLRSYRTGDRGRWRADGLLVHCGRSDWQCKVRGQKVERMEVEAALASLDGLDEVAVIDHQLDGDTQLVAYYTETSAGAPSPSVLRAQLISRLPAFMVPSRWVRLEAFPRTPTGKIARLALPLPAPLGSNGEVEDPPQTEAELQLAAVWVEVLALERVGRQDDFFMLGGHSLLAIEACERLRSRGWHLPVDRFYRAPTLAAAAAEAEPIAPKHPPEPSRPTLHTLSPAQLEAIAATVPGGAANIQDIYPLAPLQEGFLLQARLDPDHDALTVITVLSFATRADLDHYLTALRAVVDRHDILRTLFFWEGLPEPVQVVLRQVPLQDQPLSDGGGEGEACERLLLQRLPEAMGIRADQAPLLNTCSIFDGTAQRWLLRLQVHHLVTDHFSTHLMEREIRLYLAGRSDELPDPGSFRDVVAQARQGPGSAEHACFFRRLLAGISEPTIPFGLPLRRVGEEAPREARLLITAACTRRLRRTASSHGVTLATLCHLAWALVLARVTGRDDVVFGTVLLGRLRGDAATRRVMGPCINTLPVRVRLSDLSVGEACLAMQQLLAELLHHEQASLAEAQAASGVSGQGGLFSAVLNYRHQHWGSLLSKPKGDLGRPQQLLRRAFSSYPLVLSIDDGGSELSLKVQVVAPEEPERVADFMQRALEQLDHALTEAPDMSLRELDVLPEPERSLIQSWQEGPRIEVPDLCVHQLFEQQVERTPEATALVFEDQELSYAGLNARANQLAHHLIDLGVGPEVIVAVCLERSVELIVSLLAILKAGGAYLPLDPSWPKDRHALLLKEASCSVLINQDGVTILDVIAPLGKPASGSPLAYVTYTSGSTGKPKGVAISHHSIVRLVDPVNGFLLSAGHRVLQLAPVAFDAATFEIWGPLLNGGTLVMAPPEQPTLPALAALLKNHSITTLWLTAGLFHAMVEAELPALAGVQQILAGGDVLSGEHVQRLLDAFPPGHELINGYGPTENTTFTCCQHFEAAATVAPNGVAIGRPIANTEVRVLDEGGQPCPIGIPGELHIGGDGLARGYLNNPELTAEKFIPDPFSIDPSARLYKSGDLASWNPDGTLAFHGRIDQQIKLRGFRIEPGEIEAHLLAHPAVAQAVVLLRQDDPNNPRLIAYWVPDASQPSLASTGSEQLRAFLTDRLPDYMVPAAFLQLQALPLTPNGKLDRKALPTPSFSGNLEQRVAPSTDLERQLHTIWAEVLGHSDFGITDNFFAIGGHSLAAARLVSRIEHAIGFAPTLAALFQNPSIAGLAPLLSDSSAAAEENKSAKEAHQATPSENEACQIGRSKQFFADSEIDAIYPLNYIQKGFLIQSRLNKAHDPYLNIKYFTFNSTENYKKFIQACKVIAERHPLLRARFAWEELPEPAQIILKTPLEVNEISAELLSNVDIGTKLFELIPKALDLRKTPPFQIYTLNAESTERWAAAMLIHHIAYDMPSRRIIENEIRMIMAGQQQKLPEPACPSRLLQSSDAVAATSRDFFATMLQGAKPTLVPLSSESKPNKHIIAEQAQSSLDHTDVQDLFFCASLIGASSSSVILHAYSKVISRLTKSNDIILGIVIDQRSFSGFSEQSLVGPFITILPLRVPAASNSAADSASSINSTLGNLITHNTLPIKEIKKSAGLSLAEPMFNSIINIRRSESPPDPNMKQLFQGHQVDNRKNMQLSRNFPYYFLVNISEHLQSVNLSVRLPSDSQRAQEIATEFKQELEKTIKTIVLEKAPSKAGKMQD